MDFRNVAGAGDSLLPRMARRHNPLQASGVRCRLGGAAAVVHHAHLYVLLRQVGRHSQQRSTVPALLLLGAGAVDVLLRHTGARRQQPGGQLQPGYQDLFSTGTAAAALGGLLDLLMSSLLLVGMLFYYHVTPHWTMLLTPVFVAQTVLLVLG